MNSCMPGGLSIIIPIFNEEANILPLIAEIQQVLSEFDDYEIVVVDDGSHDRSVEKIHSLPSHASVQLKKHIKNLGQSAALITGIYAARHAWIATLDGDGQNNPNDLLILMDEISRHAAKNTVACFGIRAKRNDPWSKRIASKIANQLRNFFLKDHCPDTGCGIKLFSKYLFLQIPHFKNCHRFLPALFNNRGAQIIYKTVDHRPRRFGVSKYGIFNRLGTGILDLMGVAWLMHRTLVHEHDLDAFPEKISEEKK